MRFFRVAAFAALFACVPATVQAAEVDHASALGECFVMKTTGQDRILVARWMIAAIGSAPQLGDIVKVDTVKKDQTDQAMAQLFTRLIKEDCAEHSVPMLKSKDKDGFGTGGEALGKIAMQELLGNKTASASLMAFARYIDEADFATMRQ